MRFLALLSLSAVARQAFAATYTAANGEVFDISPSTDYYGGDLALEWTDTLNLCLERCSLTTGCILVSFAGPGRGPCYMKSKFYSSQTNTQITGGKLISTPVWASSSSSASSSTSATSTRTSTVTSFASSVSSSTSTRSTSSSTVSAFKCTQSVTGWKLIGDLQNNGAVTDVGRNISDCLTGQVSNEAKTDGGYTPPGARGSPACKADTCCIWSYIAADLKPLFTNATDGTCTQYARKAIRLGFHDAAGWSKPNSLAGMDYGGADGSIVLSAEEAARTDNIGLSEIIAKMKEWQATYGVGMADLIQFASNLATVTCPLGPRIRTWVGRKDSSTPAPTGLLPDVKDSVDKIICLFGDKTLSYTQLAALMGAHSTSQQFFVDPSKAGAPQDDTPGVWDTRYYNQHMPGGSVPAGVFQFASDLSIANDTRTKDQWTTFARTGRDNWAMVSELLELNSAIYLLILFLELRNRIREVESAWCQQPEQLDGVLSRLALCRNLVLKTPQRFDLIAMHLCTYIIIYPT